MWWMWVLVAVMAGAALWWLRGRLVVVSVTGPSMQPSYPDGATVLVRRAKTARTGQVVMIAPEQEGPPSGRPGRLWLMKRVAASAGDTIGAGLGPALSAGARVPAGHLVVLGDNASHSVDSRQEGFVALERLRGVVVFRIG